MVNNKVAVYFLALIVIVGLMFGYSKIYLQNGTTVSQPKTTALNSSKPGTTPEEITTLFHKLNKELSTNFVASVEEKFYSNDRDLDQKSWTLDFSDAVKGKTQIVLVKSLLEKELVPDLSRSAGGAGQSVDAYNGKEIVCYLLLGLDKKDVLTCSKK